MKAWTKTHSTKVMERLKSILSFLLRPPSPTLFICRVRVVRCFSPPCANSEVRIALDLVCHQYYITFSFLSTQYMNNACCHQALCRILPPSDKLKPHQVPIEDTCFPRTPNVLSHAAKMQTSEYMRLSYINAPETAVENRARNQVLHPFIKLFFGQE